MSIQAFRKALSRQPLSQQERDELTPNELFVLVLARRLDRLTEVEQERLTAKDRQYLASAELVSSEVLRIEANPAAVAGASTRRGNLL